MSFNIDNYGESYSQAISKDFFKQVYAYMFGALAISGLIAYMAGTPEFFMEYFTSPVDGNPLAFKPNTLFYVVAFAPVGLGLIIQTMYQRLSFGVLLLMFAGYAVLMGLSLSAIMLMYSGAQLAITFLVTAGAFAGMAILGYTTKTDLTKMGSLLYMAFIGIFIASIVNIWVGSEMMDFVISIIGVFVFTGLTAYFMQQLKTMSQQTGMSQIDRSKLALVGGLMLYILFINLFLSLLRLLGGND